MKNKGGPPAPCRAQRFQVLIRNFISKRTKAGAPSFPQFHRGKGGNARIPAPALHPVLLVLHRDAPRDSSRRHSPTPAAECLCLRAPRESALTKLSALVHRLAVHFENHVARRQARIVRRAARAHVLNGRAVHLVGKLNCWRTSGVRSATARPSLPPCAPPEPALSASSVCSLWNSPTVT